MPKVRLKLVDIPKAIKTVLFLFREMHYNKMWGHENHKKYDRILAYINSSYDYFRSKYRISDTEFILIHPTCIEIIDFN